MVFDSPGIASCRAGLGGSGTLSAWSMPAESGLGHVGRAEGGGEASGCGRSLVSLVLSRARCVPVWHASG